MTPESQFTNYHICKICNGKIKATLDEAKQIIKSTHAFSTIKRPKYVWQIKTSLYS